MQTNADTEYRDPYIYLSQNVLSLKAETFVK